MQRQIQVRTRGQGLHAITDQIESAIAGELPERAGLLQIFLQHTSASLLIQENASPSARADLEEFIQRLVPENQNWHRHLEEGPDDTVSHMKSSIVSPSLLIPFSADGELLLGTWQGIYLWEHRRMAHERRLILTAI